MVAQPVPQDALKPVEKEKTVSDWVKDILLVALLIVVILILFILLRGLFI